MRYLFLFIFLIGIYSCEFKSEEEKLVEKIHLLHDIETMPKIPYMEDLTEELNELKNTADSVKINKALFSIASADRLMYKWMDEFNFQSEQTLEKDRVKYYRGEVEKLEKLKVKMYTAIEEAETILGKKK